jgi:DNA invertase Pin-like site-specific DNA recombinase
MKMSTLKSKGITVDIFIPRGRPKGYKKKPLPAEEIRKLNEQGLGSKSIATSLKKRGIIISYKTIERLLNNERDGKVRVGK